jgi:hypothetical protein
MDERGRAKWDDPARSPRRLRRRIIRAFAASGPNVGGWESETAHLSCPRIQRLSNLGRGMVASGSVETACGASTPSRSWPGLSPQVRPRRQWSQSELNQRRDALEAKRAAQPADGFLLFGSQTLQQRSSNRIKPARRPVTRRDPWLLPAPDQRDLLPAHLRQSDFDRRPRSLLVRREPQTGFDPNNFRRSQHPAVAGGGKCSVKLWNHRILLHLDHRLHWRLRAPGCTGRRMVGGLGPGASWSLRDCRDSRGGPDDVLRSKRTLCRRIRRERIWGGGPYAHQRRCRGDRKSVVRQEQRGRSSGSSRSRVVSDHHIGPNGHEAKGTGRP